jgi:putative tryptophan/tyrosine transport system substrate-binding protein
LTGVTNLQVELGPKQVELMHEMVPTAKNIALLVNPTNQGVTEAQVKTVQAAAYRRGLELYVVTASTENDIDSAFAALVELKAAGLLITSDAFFTSRIDQLCNLSLQHAIPAIYQFREFAAAGGLATYGGSNTEAYRQAGVYTGRILKGENAAELPVHQVTKVELAINLKTAKALSLTVPEILLARADEVIE